MKWQSALSTRGISNASTGCAREGGAIVLIKGISNWKSGVFNVGIYDIVEHRKVSRLPVLFTN